MEEEEIHIILHAVVKVEIGQVKQEVEKKELEIIRENKILYILAVHLVKAILLEVADGMVVVSVLVDLVILEIHY